MSYTEMSLPVDIPWKRIGVSRGMIADIDEKENIGSDPDNWRSSIAIFYYEPSVSDLPPDYCNRRITYLKVVCTITNYQLPKPPNLVDHFQINTNKGIGISQLSEISKIAELRTSYQKIPGLNNPWARFDATITDSYPCYGALLQLSVYPNENKVELHDYPYIASFQPRKREMYEVLTESGEVASQSGSKVNISKGVTNTNTLEDYNLELGGGASGGTQLFGLTNDYQQRPQQQVGTIYRDVTQNQNITTSDASREKRESYSYSTNINQLYTLLQGYHEGTNRVLLFMQPRPHIQDTKFTFIRGLRRLEGIQEFFFVINRPASLSGLLVDAVLETAHIHAERAYNPRLINFSDLQDPKNLERTVKAIGANEASMRQLFKHEYELRDLWNEGDPYGKWLAINWSQLISAPESPSFLNIVQAILGGRDDASAARRVDPYLLEVAQTYPNIGLGKVEIVFDEYESDSGYYFVTSRRLKSRFKSSAGETVDPENSSASNVSSEDGEFIVMEDRIAVEALPTLKSSKSDSLTTNSLIYQVNLMFQTSIGSPKRLAYGKGGFLETEFILDKMSQLIQLMLTAGAKVKKGEASHILQRIFEKYTKEKTFQPDVFDFDLSKIVKLSTKQLATKIGLGLELSRKARSAILIEILKILDTSGLKEESFSTLNPIIHEMEQRRSNHFSPQSAQDSTSPVKKSKKAIKK
jgi:hypothetical protein